MNKYVQIAREAIKKHLDHKQYDAKKENDIEELFHKKAGVFVSIHLKPIKYGEEGELRGCIGTYTPTKDNIVQEIVDNAIAASSRDFRFDPIRKDELSDININVDVLSEPEIVNDISELDPKKYGILIKSKNDARSGLLLPDIVGVDTIHDQIAITLNKAGLKIKDPINIYRFVVTRYKEE